jgi:hypothetical protein
VVLGIASWGVQAGWYALAAWPRLAVRDIRVEGAERVPAGEVLATSGISIGDSWLALEGSKARDRLLAHPLVREARVLRPSPRVVKLEVREAHAVAGLVWDGLLVGVSAGLRILPAGEPGPTLPRIRGVGSPETGLDVDGLRRAVELAQLLEGAGAFEARCIITLMPGGELKLELPGEGFTAVIWEAVPPGDAVRNVSAFLRERLDSEGGRQGTLRVITGETAVWRPGRSAGR